VGAGQLRQPHHLRVVCGEVFAEHDQAVRAQGDSALAQRGCDQRQVAQRDLTVLGLRDAGGAQACSIVAAGWRAIRGGW